MKKRIAAILVLCMGCSLLTSCGSSSSGDDSATDSATESATESTTEGADDSTEKVELNYFAWSEGDALLEIVEEYNATSTVAYVNLTTVASDDYETKLTAMLAGDGDVDLYNMRSQSLLSTMATSGNLVDISSYIQESGLDVSVYGTGFAETQIDGSFYSLPYRSQSYALFYNKVIFDENGLDYPTNITWDEYEELALALTTGSGADKVYGGYIPEWLYAPFMTQQTGSNIADDDLTATQLWLEELNLFYNTDNSHMSYTEMISTGTDYIQYFVSGNAAMMPNGEWVVSDVTSALESDPTLSDSFELGIGLLPQLEETDEPLTLGGVSTFVGINATSENVEAAFDFICYMAGEEGAKIIAASGLIPAYTSDEVTETYMEALGYDGAEYLLDVDKVFEGLFTSEFTELQTIYTEEKELYLIGEQTIEETLESFESRRAELTAE